MEPTFVPIQFNNNTYNSFKIFKLIEALLAKTTEPHPKLPGTIYSAAKEIEAAGGKSLPIACDIRDEKSVISAIK